MHSKDLNQQQALLFTRTCKEQGEANNNFDTFNALLKTCFAQIITTDNLPSPDELKDYALLFVDLEGQSWCNQIPEEIKAVANSKRIVLFNASNDQLCEKRLLLAGIAGIFYQDERPDIILKGLTQLTKNERWFKRETMNQALTELLDGNTNLDLEEPTKVHFPTLTRRENAIIRLVSSGAKNQEIADQLHISPNTVKTHLYSIFRKTHSRNRVELITLSQKMGASLN